MPRDPTLTLDISAWSEPVTAETALRAVEALESGRLIVLPGLGFGLEAGEAALMQADFLPAGRKNISYDPATGKVGAAGGHDAAAAALLRRFSQAAETLLWNLLAPYAPHLRPGRTSLRPAEIQGRDYSVRHDDRLLHVDAFPTRPTGGERILRLFTNLPGSGRGRDWRVEGPFERVAARYVRSLPAPAPLRARLSARLGLTKGVRSAYDQMMLALHDRMKRDTEYQRQADAAALSFPPGTTWLCFTDQVPHAAMAGRWAMEQTFILPVEAMRAPETSPLRVLEQLTNRRLAA